MISSNYVPKAMFQEYRLPSQGLTYPKPKENVQVRAMTAAELGILALNNLSLWERLRRLVPLISDLKLENPGDVLFGDAVFILGACRSISFGADYVVPIMPCPECGAAYTQGKDQQPGKHKMRFPDQTPVRVWENVSEGFLLVNLEEANDTVLLKAPTLDESHEAHETIQKNRRHNPNLIEEHYALASFIAKVNGTSGSLVDIAKYIASLPVRDYQALETAIDEAQPGVRTVLDIECDVCGAKYTSPLGLGAQFFRWR